MVGARPESPRTPIVEHIHRRGPMRFGEFVELALYGPGGEQAALQTYRRLPSGAAAAESAREVSAALAALVGEQLEAVSVSALGPGSFSLSLGAAGRELTVRLDQSGVRVASVGA